MAVKALACELPAAQGVPLARWPRYGDRNRQVVEAGIVASISDTTIWRWLAQDAVRPWRVRSWIFPRDPDFGEKAARVLDLYHRRFGGKPLGRKDFVLCADEKTGLQALRRCHPTDPPGPGRPLRVEHEYRRGGTLAYLAAWDVHRARLHARCEPTTGIVPFGRLVAQVTETEPYRSARRVFWVVNNGSSHRGEASIRRMRKDWPNARLVHLPVHASWLNQIEIYFSVLARKLLTPTDFCDLEDLASRVLAFQDYYQESARPFEWKFTRSDLDRLLARLEEPEIPHQRAA